MKRIFVEFDTDLEVHEIEDYLSDFLIPREFGSIRWSSEYKGFMMDTSIAFAKIRRCFERVFSGVEVHLVGEL